MKFLFYPITVLILALVCTEFYPVLMYACKHVVLYKWFLYGLGGYLVLRKLRIFSRNERWLQTTSHEATHAIVGMMFFHKIHSLEANDGHGVVYHSGRRFGDIFISLAPYCLPVVTYAFLLFRIMGANKMLYIFDLLIGFSLAFHIICFWSQTRPYQTDIQNHGYFKSYLFIITAWIFNATIILLSIRKGIVESFSYLFPKYWNDLLSWWNFVVNLF